MTWQTDIEFEVGVAVGAWAGDVPGGRWGPSTVGARWDGSSRWGSGDGGGETPTVWEVVTCDVSALQTSIGARQWSGNIEPGTASITLDNRSGRYVPELSPIPLRIGRRVRVRFRDRAGTQDWRTLYTGTIRSIDQTNPPSGISAVVVSAVDALASFAAVRLVASPTVEGDGETAGARIGRILDRLLWPSADRDLDLGSVPLRGTTYGATALDLARRAELADSGRLYVDPSGSVRFVSGEAWRIMSIKAPSFRVLADGSLPDPAASIPEVCAGGLDLSHRVEDVSNLVRVTVEGDDQIPPAEASDPTSIAAYGPRTLDLATIIRDQVDRDDMADAVLASRKDAKTRVTAVRFPVVGFADLETLAAADLGEVARVVYAHPWGGWGFDTRAQIVGRTVSAPASGPLTVTVSTDAAVSMARHVPARSVTVYDRRSA